MEKTGTGKRNAESAFPIFQVVELRLWLKRKTYLTFLNGWCGFMIENKKRVKQSIND